MDGRPGIDHCEFSRGALRHSPFARHGMKGRERSFAASRRASTRGHRRLDHRPVL